MLIYLTLPSLFFFFLATHTHKLALAYVSKKDKKEREKKVKAMQKAADKAAKAQAKAAKKKEKEDKKKRKGSSNALAKEEEFGGFGEVPSNGAESMTLHVFSANARARSVYEKAGYEDELRRCIKHL